MASIKRRGKTWRALVFKNGVRDSCTFYTRSEASKWARSRESEIETGLKKESRKTLAEALDKYRENESPKKRGWRWEVTRLKNFAETMDCRDVPMNKLEPSHLADWRDTRLKQVSAATVLREINLLRSVIEKARKEWGWINTNPIKDISKPPSPPHRKRLVSEAERDAVVEALGYEEGMVPYLTSHRVAMAFLLALETAMRSGEIYDLDWSRVNLAGRYVVLTQTKNGDVRDVPLSKKAVAILECMPERKGPVFGVNKAVADTLFRRARAQAKLEGFVFHDARHTACTRLAAKLHVLDLARMIGHRDLRSLQVYYNPTASELASRLD